jgi:GTPase SAR1 family protein
MSGIESLAPTIVKLGGAIISKAPTGLKYVKSLFVGKTVVIVGQERSGKTTFLEYFQFGFFEDEKDSDKTYDISPSVRFDVKLGRNETLELSIKTVVDIPGQLGANFQAKEIFERKPHAFLIFLDLTRPQKDLSIWLSEFCKRLETYWRVNKSKRNRVKSIILVLNKTDKVDNKTVTARKNALRKIIDLELRDARGKMTSEIAVIPTVMVNNPNGTKSADSLITHLAKYLVK